MGLAAIGRPSDTGGVDRLAQILRDIQPDREIVAVGELDANDKGQWPGHEGAIKTAAGLSNKLGRRVRWALPPDGAKDTRAWLLAQNADLGCRDDLHESGERFISRMRRIDLKN